MPLPRISAPRLCAKGIAAGKHIYAEKPVATTVAEGHTLIKSMSSRRLGHAAVEDKQYLPGMRSFPRWRRQFLRPHHGLSSRVRLVGVRRVRRTMSAPELELPQGGGGGLMLDMYPHFRYLIEGMLGPIRRVVTMAATTAPERVDEAGEAFAVDVEDQATTLVELASGANGVIVASWTRVRRDDLLTFQIDGSTGSAVAGLHRCYTQALADTPKVAAFNPVTDLNIDYRARWQEAPAPVPIRNPYRVGWEHFLRHLVADAPLPSDFAAGIRDLAFAEACVTSARDGTWIALDDAREK